MSEAWSTDEPEVGQPVRVYGQDKYTFWVYRGKVNGYFIFDSKDGTETEEDIPEWQPIITPEKARLRKRLEEFEGALIRMVNVAEYSGLTVFNHEYEATKWAKYVLKHKGDLPEAGEGSNDN